MFADYHKDVFDCSISIWRPNGKCVKVTKPEWVKAPADSAAPDVKISFIKQRPVFTKMLYDQCVRLGIPIIFSQQATSFAEDEDHVTVHTSDGTTYVGDVCIAADGIGTSFTKDLEISQAPVLDSGYAAARAAFPMDNIKAGSPAESLLKNVKDEPEFRVILGNDLHLILFLTHDHVAFVYTHEVSLYGILDRENTLTIVNSLMANPPRTGTIFATPKCSLMSSSRKLRIGIPLSLTFSAKSLSKLWIGVCDGAILLRSGPLREAA